MRGRVLLWTVALTVGAAVQAKAQAKDTITSPAPGVIEVRKAGPGDGRYLGFSVNYTGVFISPDGLPIHGPAVVSWLADDSPAKLAGLAVGDTVVAVNGKEMGKERVSISAPPGTKLTYLVRRTGVEREVSFVVGSRKKQ